MKSEVDIERPVEYKKLSEGPFLNNTRLAIIIHRSIKIQNISKRSDNPIGQDKRNMTTVITSVNGPKTFLR